MASSHALMQFLAEESSRTFWARTPTYAGDPTFHMCAVNRQAEDNVIFASAISEAETGASRPAERLQPVNEPIGTASGQAGGGSCNGFLRSTQRPKPG
jgi:hypothetical protein